MHKIIRRRSRQRAELHFYSVSKRQNIRRSLAKPGSGRAKREQAKGPESLLVTGSAKAIRKLRLTRLSLAKLRHAKLWRKLHSEPFKCLATLFPCSVEALYGVVSLSIVDTAILRSVVNGLLNITCGRIEKNKRGYMTWPTAFLLYLARLGSP